MSGQNVSTVSNVAAMSPTESKRRIYEQLLTSIDECDCDCERLFGLCAEGIARAGVVLLTDPNYVHEHWLEPESSTLEQDELATFAGVTAAAYLTDPESHLTIINSSVTYRSCNVSASRLVYDPHFQQILFR